MPVEYSERFLIRTSDFEATKDWYCDALGFFKERRVDDRALYRVFLFDPGGVKIALNFAADEAEGRKAAAGPAAEPPQRAGG